MASKSNRKGNKRVVDRRVVAPTEDFAREADPSCGQTAHLIAETVCLGHGDGVQPYPTLSSLMQMWHGKHQVSREVGRRGIA